MKFKFVEFNQRRAARGAEGARVLVTNDDGTDDLLWMSKRDIAKNMMAFGRCDELTKAHQAYLGTTKSEGEA
jgi:hypothetical protein